MDGVSAIEYHGNEQPLDLQTRLATVLPGLKLSTLLCVFLNVIMHLLASKCATIGLKVLYMLNGFTKILVLP